MTERLRAIVYTRRLDPVDSRAIPGVPPTEVAGDQVATTGGRSGWTTPAAVAVVLGILSLLFLGYWRHSALRLAGAAAVAVVALAVPVLLRISRGRSFDLAGIAITGLGLKLIGVAVRYDVIFGTYEGTADAGSYHTEGARLADAYRSFNFSEPANQGIPGTGFIRVVVGYVYAVLGSHIGVGFVVFGLFGFVGAWLFYRAFETALPGGDHRRYALLVFLWPSLLFWPASLGKEAWVILGIGLSAYGAARAFTQRRGGFLLAAVGLWAVTMTRPHITLLLFAAFAIGYLLRPGAPGSRLSPVAKVIGLVAIFVASGVVSTQFLDFFGIDGFDRESIEATFDETEKNSQQGGSGFQPPDPFNPVGYVLAVVTILVRPFPWEGGNLQMLFTSLEGLVLAALLVRSAPRLLHLVRHLRRWAYGTAALAYLAGFAFAFASIANFGILARQRTQLLPFVFVLLCLPPVTAISGADGNRSAEPARRRR